MIGDQLEDRHCNWIGIRYDKNENIDFVRVYQFESNNLTAPAAPKGSLWGICSRGIGMIQRKFPSTLTSRQRSGRKCSGPRCQVS